MILTNSICHRTKKQGITTQQMGFIAFKCVIHNLNWRGGGTNKRQASTPLARVTTPFMNDIQLQLRGRLLNGLMVKLYVVVYYSLMIKWLARLGLIQPASPPTPCEMVLAILFPNSTLYSSPNSPLKKPTTEPPPHLPSQNPATPQWHL